MQLVVEYVADVVKEARKRGEHLSSADAIGATQHALMLARLRGRRAPVLDDIIDALVTCCCKGNPRTDAAHLLEAIDEVNIGTRLGRVTDRVGRLPIVNDFYEQLQRLELEEAVAREKVCSYTFDKRQPADIGAFGVLAPPGVPGRGDRRGRSRSGALRAIGLQGTLAVEVEP